MRHRVHVTKLYILDIAAKKWSVHIFASSSYCHIFTHYCCDISIYMEVAYRLRCSLTQYSICVSMVVWVFQVSELGLQVAILYYGGHLVVTGQMSSGTLIAFIIYELELGECLDVWLIHL